MAKWKPFGRFSGCSVTMPWASYKSRCGTADSKMAAFRCRATLVPVGSQQAEMTISLTKCGLWSCRTVVSPSENLRRRWDKHWFGTFHFDRWFGHAENVREIRAEAANDGAEATASGSLERHAGLHSCGSTGSLLSWHGSLRFLAVPSPESDLIWVTRRLYTEHDGHAVLHSQRSIPEMLRTMAEQLEELCSVTRRLLRRGLGLQTSRSVNVFFPAKGRILFEQSNIWIHVYKTET